MRHDGTKAGTKVLANGARRAYLARRNRQRQIAPTLEWMMLTDEERGYYERRAEKQLLMAAATMRPEACASHYRLANLYLDLAYRGTTTRDPVDRG